MLIPKGHVERRRVALIRQFLITKQCLRSANLFQLALAPITTLPTRFPRVLFEQGEAATPVFHQMLDSMTRDVAGLLEMYARIRLEDEFVNAFCEIVEHVYVSGRKDINTCLRAYVTRNDFMINQAADEDAQPDDEHELKQVEINLSSVVGPHSMQELSSLHRDLVIREYRSKLPNNAPRDRLVRSLTLMNSAYLEKYPQRRTCLLWIVGKFESNYPEILTTVNALTTALPHTPVFLVTWDDLVERISSIEESAADGILRFNPVNFIYNEESYEFEVSVVYFRTGYAPDHYQTLNHWRMRELLEATRAIVIPSAISQLTGLKKAQQAWSNSAVDSVTPSTNSTDAPTYSSVLEKHLGGNQIKVAQLSKLFVDQVDVGDYGQDARATGMIEDAIQHPHQYVLKPQREGGGNNTYGDKISETLRNHIQEPKQKSSFILMRKINSPKNLTEVFVDNQLSIRTCTSEIGFYGAALWDADKELLNENLGYLLRTKEATEDEGGICLGVAVFDSVMLV